MTETDRYTVFADAAPPSYGIKPLEYCLWLLQNIRALCKPQSGESVYGLVNCHEHLRTELYRELELSKDIPSPWFHQHLVTVGSDEILRLNVTLDLAWNQTYWNSTNYRHNISFKNRICYVLHFKVPFKSCLNSCHSILDNQTVCRCMTKHFCCFLRSLSDLVLIFDICSITDRIKVILQIDLFQKSFGVFAAGVNLKSI